MIIDLFIVNKVVIILIDVIAILLGYWVYSSNPRQGLNQVFVGMVFFMMLWVNFAYLARFLGDLHPYLVLLFLKIAWFATPLFFILLYVLSLHLFVDNFKYKIINIVIIFLAVVTSLIIGFTDHVVMDVMFMDEFLIRLVYGDWMLQFLISIFLFIVATLQVLFKKYYFSSKNDRKKIEYYLFGIIIFYIANIIFNIALPIFLDITSYYFLGDYSTIFLLLFIAYAIVKNELMGIKILVTQILIVVISIILLVDIVALTGDGFMMLLKIGVLITFLYFARDLVISIKKEKEVAEKLQDANEKIRHYVEKLEDSNKTLEERNEDLKALLDASDAVVKEMDSKKIAQGVVDIIPKSLGHLGNKGGVYISYNRDSKIMQAYAITESALGRKAKKFLGKSLEKHKNYITDVDNLVAKTIQDKKIFVGSKLEDFIAPTVGVSICKIIQKVTRAKSFVSVPLYSRGNVIGVLLFLGIKNEKKITKRDKNILYMFSSHTGNAIENARLYEQTNLQIKEMKKLNKDLGKANVKLKELLEIKNEFLHITSHQLRTPLTAIRGMISMWVDGDFDDLPLKEKKGMVKRILISTERLNNITNDMLDALELEGGFLKFQFKKSSIADIVKETIDTLKPNFDEKKLYIKIKIEKGLPDCDVEPNYIRQVFMNTIDNACKYTREGGIEISVKKSGNKFIEVKIKDTGVGIKKDERAKVFEKFARGKNAIEENATGSGLGMFIARKIISAHNGKIGLKSDGLGKGTTVSVLLKIKQV